MVSSRSLDSLDIYHRRLLDTVRRPGLFCFLASSVILHVEFVFALDVLDVLVEFLEAGGENDPIFPIFRIPYEQVAVGGYGDQDGSRRVELYAERIRVVAGGKRNGCSSVCRSATLSPTRRETRRLNMPTVRSTSPSLGPCNMLFRLPVVLSQMYTLWSDLLAEPFDHRHRWTRNRSRRYQLLTGNHTIALVTEDAAGVLGTADLILKFVGKLKNSTFLLDPVDSNCSVGRTTYCQLPTSR
jgi:hypothetical protein